MPLGLRLIRSNTTGNDDDDPSVQAPVAADLFIPHTMRKDAPNAPVVGFRGKLVFDDPVANTADLEVWTRNDADGSWTLAGEKPGLVSNRLFIQNDLSDAVVFFRLVNISGGDPIEIWAEEA